MTVLTHVNCCSEALSKDSGLTDRLKSSKKYVLIGKPKVLLSDGVKDSMKDLCAPGVLQAMVDATKPGDNGASTSTFTADGKQLVLLVLPEVCSRHNCSARPHTIYETLPGLVGGSDDVTVLAALESLDQAYSTGVAVFKSFFQYSRKTSDAEPTERSALVDFCSPDGTVPQKLRDQIKITGDNARLAIRLMDAPCSELHTSAFVEEARNAVKGLPNTTIEVIEGEELRERGFGMLYGVGKAASHPPALVILSHVPPSANASDPAVCWVGKGIVYDTGGLSLKTSLFMPGMKMDMGGAAGMLGAFVSAVKFGTMDKPLHTLLCLAENAVSDSATRPDDVHIAYSGKSVEVNNTDAEGRLAMGDGVAYAVKHLNPSVVVDMATLTGAQMITTGQHHAAVMSSDEEYETLAVKCGKESGDLCFPILYCPEFTRPEFNSVVADMKNSVKSRANAQASCAGQFVANHLSGFQGPHVHIDMAGPGEYKERGTGYGVALLLKMFVPF